MHAATNVTFMLDNIEENMAYIRNDLAEVSTYPEDHRMFGDNDLGFYLRGEQRGKAKAVSQALRSVAKLRRIANDSATMVDGPKAIVSALSTILWDMAIIAGPYPVSPSNGFESGTLQAGRAGEVAGAGMVADQVNRSAHLWLTFAEEPTTTDRTTKNHRDTFLRFMTHHTPTGAAQ